LENWLEVEFILLKHLKLQPDVLDKMEFYRVEYMLQNYEEFIEEVPDKPIRFNCDFETDHGINHEMYYNIRYSPSNDLISYITMNSGIYLKITTYDGTLREESGYTTLIRK
jgi:hypothetical protein